MKYYIDTNEVKLTASFCSVPCWFEPAVINAHSTWRQRKARQSSAHAFLFISFLWAISCTTFRIIMSFPKPCHMPFYKLILSFRACLQGVGDPGLVGLVSFVFTLWGTQTKETYPTRPGSPTPYKQGLTLTAVRSRNSKRAITDHIFPGIGFFLVFRKHLRYVACMRA